MRGLDVITKVAFLGHITITSAYTNLYQNSASEYRPSRQHVSQHQYQQQQSHQQVLS